MRTLPGGRWAIHIDIEGFGELYPKENQVLSALGELMKGIFLIGSRCFPKSPDRLFAHQLGDGFVIVSDFPEKTLERPVGIAMALLRHVAQSGRFAKATIAEGQFADIHSCYPPTVLAAKGEGGCVALGTGVMTLFPVMGSALIHAVAASKRCPKGPLLAVGAVNRGRLPTGLRLYDLPDSDLVIIDWVNSEGDDLARSISNEACLNSPNPRRIRELIAAYCSAQKLPEEWSANAMRFLEVESD